MNKDRMITATIKGLGAAALAWIFYGVFTSFFDDTVIEQMFEPSGIFFAVSMAIIAVTFFIYRSGKKGETEKES